MLQGDLARELPFPVGPVKTSEEECGGEYEQQHAKSSATLHAQKNRGHRSEGHDLDYHVREVQRVQPRNQTLKEERGRTKTTASGVVLSVHCTRGEVTAGASIGVQA